MPTTGSLFHERGGDWTRHLPSEVGGPSCQACLCDRSPRKKKARALEFGDGSCRKGMKKKNHRAVIYQVFSFCVS